MVLDFTDPVLYIQLNTLFLIVLTAGVVLLKEHVKDDHKKLLFYLFVVPTLLSSVYLGGHTVYKNINSATGGPVHWHYDYEVWACDQRLDLVNPRGLINKIGSPLFHEHNDDRVHIEGTVAKLSNVDLGSYFAVIGGKLTPNELHYDVEGEGMRTFTNGDLCSNGEVGVVNVYINGERRDDFETHVPYPHALVPPGDCIIVEFGPYSETTERICTSWSTKDWNYDNYNELRGEAN